MCKQKSSSPYLVIITISPLFYIIACPLFYIIACSWLGPNLIHLIVGNVIEFLQVGRCAVLYGTPTCCQPFFYLSPQSPDASQKKQMLVSLYDQQLRTFITPTTLLTSLHLPYFSLSFVLGNFLNL